MGGNRRPAWEWLIFVVIIVLVVGTVGMSYRSQQRLDKQKALHYQLQLLRSAELLYNSVNKTNPKDLKELAMGKFQLVEENPGRPYLDPPPPLSGDKILDPFGNPYIYDPATGRIRSSTQGYDFW